MLDRIRYHIAVKYFYLLPDIFYLFIKYISLNQDCSIFIKTGAETNINERVIHN